MDSHTSEAPGGQLAGQWNQPGYRQFYAGHDSRAHPNPQVTAGNRLIGFGISGLLAMSLVRLAVNVLSQSPAQLVTLPDRPPKAGLIFPGHDARSPHAIITFLRLAVGLLLGGSSRGLKAQHSVHRGG